MFYFLVRNVQFAIVGREVFLEGECYTFWTCLFTDLSLGIKVALWWSVSNVADDCWADSQRDKQVSKHSPRFLQVQLPAALVFSCHYRASQDVVLSAMDWDGFQFHLYSGHLKLVYDWNHDMNLWCTLLDRIASDVLFLNFLFVAG